MKQTQKLGSVPQRGHGSRRFRTWALNVPTISHSRVVLEILHSFCSMGVAECHLPSKWQLSIFRPVRQSCCIFWKFFLWTQNKFENVLKRCISDITKFCVRLTGGIGEEERIVSAVNYFSDRHTRRRCLKLAKGTNACGLGFLSREAYDKICNEHCRSYSTLWFRARRASPVSAFPNQIFGRSRHRKHRSDGTSLSQQKQETNVIDVMDGITTNNEDHHI